MAVRFQFIPGRGQSERFDAIQKRLRAPLGGPCGRAIVENVIRRGRGSIDHQFASTTTFDERGASHPWPPTRPFGNRRPGPSTLVQRGAYRGGWMGARGNRVEIGDRRLVVGVDRHTFPQVVVFQKLPGSVTVIRPRKSTIATRHTAMRSYLGMRFGAWISEERLLLGLQVPSRPLRVNPFMHARAIPLVRSYILTGNPRSLEAAA